MEPNIEEIRKNYERFDDEKLVRLATQEAAKLRPEALELLKSILKKRGASNEIIRAIKAQTQDLHEGVLREYAEFIRNLNCPHCGSNASPLNATLKSEVKSYVFLSNYSKELKIACPNCLDRENRNGSVNSMLFGWWAFPMGLVRTIQAIVSNNKMKQQNRLDGPNQNLLAFVKENIGLIEMNRHAPSEMEKLIKF